MVTKRLSSSLLGRFAWIVVLGVALGLPGPASAADDLTESEPAVGAPAAETLGHVNAWDVTFVKSRTGDTINSMTAIGIRNTGKNACQTAVDWSIGGGGVVCTTLLTISPGQSFQHCSRSVASGAVTCSATCDPEQTFVQGYATVTTTPTCKSKLEVDARVYYLTGTPEQITGVVDPKVISAGKKNSGD